MSPALPRLLTAATLGVAAIGLTTLTSLLVAVPAHAAAASSGTVRFSGDQGDWITGGDSFSYVAGFDQVDVSASANHRAVRVYIDGLNGDWWTLDFAAPLGQSLTTGTYDVPTYPFNDGGAGFRLWGSGRGCNEFSATFTVLDVAIGTDGEVERFHATFEQHCDGEEAAARGEVRIGSVPDAPELDLDLALSTQGTADVADGAAVLNGTVTCSKATPVRVAGTVVQENHRKLITGSYATEVDCTPGAAVAWTASARPAGRDRFTPGKVEARTEATGHDADHDADVTVSDTTVVDLRPGGVPPKPKK